MNFTTFGGHFPPGTIPTATIHQFGTAKFAHNAGGQMLSVIGGGDGAVQYIRQVDPNGFTVATAQGTGSSQHPQVQQALITLPISIGGKPGEPGQPQQTVQIQVVNPNATTIANNGTANNGAPKYHISPLSLHHFPQGVLTVAYSGQQQTGTETMQLQVQHPQIQVSQASNTSPQSQDISNNNSSSSNNNNNTQNQQTQVSLHQAQQAQHQTITVTAGDKHDQHQQTFPVTVVALQPQDLILREAVTAVELAAAKSPQQDGSGSKDNTLQLAIVKTEGDKDIQGDDDYNGSQHTQGGTVTTMPPTWQSLATPGSTVADYLSRLPASTLPLSLHHFLKFSAETIKREAAIESSPLSNPELVDANSATSADGTLAVFQGVGTAGAKPKKKKRYKKKPPKPRRPRPGQVHIATALDGTTLFCCPECHMAYPEKELLEQHLVGHKIERRFICDICGAGLKRKEHLERHKLGHNPDRPFICSVCHKGFKRKEHLNLHFVIHSGEKTEVCTECGKGFYRKDHLRKHARSHIAKRVKEEMSNQQQQHQQQAAAAAAAAAAAGATMVTTVVLPTAAETGAMMLQHHH
jgi:hypothetical protein